MKQIKLDINDCVSAETIEEIRKEVAALKEPQLTVTCELPHLPHRTLYINYPNYFEDTDILHLGTMIGAMLLKSTWVKTVKS
jgi:hypothetical protein